ncbi:cell division protein PerM [Actinomycetospora sp. C-140]
MTVPTSDAPRRGRRAAVDGRGDVDPSGTTRTPQATTPGWLPVLARVALLPPAICYGVAVVLAGVIAALASGTTPGGEPGLGQALAVGIPLWLVAHLVPLQVTGVPLGVLPLAPAALLATLIATVARGAVTRTGPRPGHGVLVPVVATAAAAHAVIGVLAAALLTPETVVDASPGLAGVTCGILAGLAALAGVARPCGLRLLPARVPGWARAGLRGGLLGAVALLTAGTGLLLAGFVADAASVRDVFADVAPEAGSGAGLALLTLAYLPNAVVAAAAWLVGPGVSIGLASATPATITSGLLPPIPLAALLPQSTPPTWAGLAFAVPLAVGSIVGWRLAPTAPDAASRVRATVTAAAAAALLVGLAATLSGGRLGAGPFDPVSLSAGLVTVAVLGWIVVPGLVVALLAVPLGTSGAQPARRSSTGRAAPAPRAGAVAEESRAAQEPAADAETEDGEDAEDAELGEDAPEGSDDATDDATDAATGPDDVVVDSPDEGVRPGGDGRG